MRLESTCTLPHFGAFPDLVRLICDTVEEGVENCEISLREIVCLGVPEADKDNPAPFVSWYRGQVFDSDPLPYSFTFLSGGGLWLVAGLDCHLIGAETSVSATIQTPN